MICCIDDTNISKSISEEVWVQDRPNFTMQSDMVCGAENTISAKIYGTVFREAVPESDELWVDMTNFFFGKDEISCAAGSASREIAVTNNVYLAKVKINVTLSAISPDNCIKFGVIY